MNDRKTDAEPVAADERFVVKISAKGPYLVYGKPPMATQFIMPDKEQGSWYYQQGRKFATGAEPTALCRCGASRRKPYCDGSHLRTEWDPTLTAPIAPSDDGTEHTRGGEVDLEDRPAYCTFARFCSPHGDAWTLAEHSDDPEARRLAIREASMCPGGRLTARDRATGEAYELRFAPSLGLLEDPELGVSGGLWVRGGIALRREDGTAYGRRNRVVLCRCGRSKNKPYCDGSHAAAKWRDGIEDRPSGQTLPPVVE